MIAGEFSKQGYAIYSDGEQIYQAGNSQFDSQVFVEPDTAGALAIQEMQRFCASTAHEISQERNEQNGGIEYNGYLFIDAVPE